MKPFLPGACLNEFRLKNPKTLKLGWFIVFLLHVSLGLSKIVFATHSQCGLKGLEKVFFPPAKLEVGKVFADRRGLFLVVREEPLNWVVHYILENNKLSNNPILKTEFDLGSIRPLQDHILFPDLGEIVQHGETKYILDFPQKISVNFQTDIIDKSKPRFYEQEALYFEPLGQGEPSTLFATGYLDQNFFLRLNFRLVGRSGVRVQGFRGADQIQKIFTHFSPKIRGIAGLWIDGTNYDQFYEGLQKSLKPDEAALNTWTGKAAKNFGFQKVKFLNLDGSEKTSSFSIFRPETVRPLFH
jgi:hypothetical protein